MQCDHVRAQLLLRDDERVETSVKTHVAGCEACASLRRTMVRMDAILAPALVASPPTELSARLLTIARASAVAQPAPESTPAAEPTRTSAWRRTFGFAGPPAWVSHPPTLVAQVVAGIAIALAGWQVNTWFNGVVPVLGDVPYAVELVLRSPAIQYVGDLPSNVDSLVAWSLVGVGAWLVSESSPLGRRTAGAQSAG